ncbi:MAG TPA: TPM domain-containing protein, partial [Gemmatimonadaceae bacterium]
MLSTIGGRLAFLAAALLFQGGPQIPPPRGLVNDFANVLQPEAAARMERIAQDVRDKSKGEIAIVTLPDLGGREASEVALRIGREWKVGNLAPIGSGDRSRNAGVVILLVPKETSSDGQGHCRIETGQGAEGFITDATSGDICREATPAFRARDYSTGLELVTLRVAQRYAQEFGFTLDTSLAAPIVQRPVQRPTGSRGGGINPLFYLFILFIVLSLFGGRGRGGCAPFLMGAMLGGGFRGRGGG